MRFVAKHKNKFGEELIRRREELERKRREEEKVNAARRAFETRRGGIKDFVLDENMSQLERRVEQKYLEAENKLTKDAMEESVVSFLNSVDLNNVYKGIVTEKVNGIKPNSMTSIRHNNVIVVGKTGVGKSTLLNEVLCLKEGSPDAAKTGIGKPVTQGKPKVYTSGDLRIYDTKGIEVGKSHGVDEMMRDVAEVVERTAHTNDPDKCIHAIWYCVLTHGGRLEETEKEALIKLMETYDGGNLPVVIVLTQTYSKEDGKAMEAIIREIVEERARIIPVVAKEKVIKSGHVIQPYGIEDLLGMTKECAKISVAPAFRHSVKVQVESVVAASYNNAAFIRGILSDGNNAIEEMKEKVKRLTELDDKFFYVRGALSNIVRLWVGMSGKSDYRGYFGDVMGVITKWANEVFTLFKAELARDDYGLPAKYEEAKKQAEREHGSMDIGVPLHDYVVTDKKEITSKLIKASVDIAFEEASKYAVNVFVDTFYKVFMDKIREELSSESSLLMIDEFVKTYIN